MYIITERSQVIRMKWLSIIKDETSFFREINYFSKYSSKNKFKMARMKSRKKHFLCKLSRLVIHSKRVIIFNKYPQIPASCSYLFPVSYKSFAQNIFLSMQNQPSSYFIVHCKALLSPPLSIEISMANNNPLQLQKLVYN